MSQTKKTNENAEPAGGPRRGFTLTEILVVVGVILLMATLALPAFNAMTGSRSVEAATNLISARAASARSEAMSRQQPVGLAVYYDVERGRTALATVGFAQRWEPNVGYQRGDLIYRDEIVGGTTSRGFWLCHTSHTSASGDSNDLSPTRSTSGTPVYSGGVSGRWTLMQAGNWTAPDSPNYAFTQYLTILPESDVTYLPSGIGAQVLNAQRSRGSGSVLTATDRYVRAGVVIFDADGKIMTGQRWGTLFSPDDAPAPMGPATASTTTFRSTRLGLAVRPNTDGTSSARAVAGVSYNLDPVYSTTSPATPNSAELTAGLGVMLFDRAAYLAQNPPLWDAQTTNTNYVGSAEEAAEAWLDANGTLVFLNRYTGTVLKVE